MILIPGGLAALAPAGIAIESFKKATEIQELILAGEEMQIPMLKKLNDEYRRLQDELDVSKARKTLLHLETRRAERGAKDSGKKPGAHPNNFSEKGRRK